MPADLTTRVRHVRTECQPALSALPPHRPGLESRLIMELAECLLLLDEHVERLEGRLAALEARKDEGKRARGDVVRS